MAEGLENVLKNLRKEMASLEGNAEVAGLRAALFVEGEATRRAPIETGNLRGSGGTEAIPGGGRVKFDAEYALWVHEIDKNYRIGGWKYLERAIEENQDRILELYMEGMKLD